MSEFNKRFLMEEGRRLNPESGRHAALAAFGKHPGWDDHIEDLGLETDSLNLAKHVLYVEGVGGQINTGAWENLREEQRLPSFNHTFVWQRADQFLLGRMWSSSDGKGRTRYPMILCAHFIGVPLAWAVAHVLPRLEDAEKSCRAAKTADEVRAILDRTRMLLRSMLNDPAVNSAGNSPAPAVLNQMTSAPAFGPGNLGWYRIIYWLHSQTGIFGVDRFNLKQDLSGIRAPQVRVPAGVPPTRTVPLWARFFGLYVDRLVPALLVWPADQDWMDVTFGEPASHEFFCLRAGREAVPMATEIPYDFDAQFREEAVRQLTAFQTGSAMLPAKAAGPDNPDESGTRRWFKNLTGKFLPLLLLAVLSAGAVLVLQKWVGSHAEKPVLQQAAAAVSSSTPGLNEALSKHEETNAVEQARLAAEKKRLEEEKRILEAEKKKFEETRRVEEARLEEARRVADEKHQRAEAEAAARAVQKNTQTVAVAMAPIQPATTAEAAEAESTISSELRPVVGQKIITNGVGMVLLWIAYLPGTQGGGWVGKYEVRQAEYQQVARSNPSRFPDPSQPVENVTWSEAVDFCRKLSIAEETAGRLPQGYAYTLPTQEQWDYFLGDAMFEDRGFENAITSRRLQYPREKPSPAGTMPPNMFGLCDVLGNVWEWCANSEVPDQKVLKGGAYNSGKKLESGKPFERTTPRMFPSDARAADAGFRCVLALAR